jgi:ABC-type iron transport system FetAB ATPase subunit
MAVLRLEGIRPEILEPVDLTLAQGELVFVSGPSGSGKSLLLRAVADLDPHQGEARLDGTARSAMPAPEWRRRVGLLPAESHWWGDRVGDHFPTSRAYEAPDGAGGERSSDPTDLLRRLGFGPEVLDWAVSRLSTGERQRLALARLLANLPQVLLLDEATANLDPSNRARVEEVIEDYRRDRGVSVLWVSHDPEQRRRLGGRRLIIRDGRLEPEE